MARFIITMAMIVIFGSWLLAALIIWNIDDVIVGTGRLLGEAATAFKDASGG